MRNSTALTLTCRLATLLILISAVVLSASTAAMAAMDEEMGMKDMDGMEDMKAMHDMKDMNDMKDMSSMKDEMYRSMLPDNPMALKDYRVIRGQSVEGHVDTWRLNVRTGPGLNYDVHTVIKRGHVLAAHRRSSDSKWVQIPDPLGGEDKVWVYAGLTTLSATDVAGLRFAGPADAACGWVQTKGMICSNASPGYPLDCHWITYEGDSQVRVFSQYDTPELTWYEIYHRGGRRWVEFYDLSNACGPLPEYKMSMSMDMSMDKDMGMDKDMSMDKDMDKDMDMKDDDSMM